MRHLLVCTRKVSFAMVVFFFSIPTFASDHGEQIQSLKSIVAHQQLQIEALKKIVTSKFNDQGEVKIGNRVIIDRNGKWVGDPANLVGPQGPHGPQGVRGLQGPQGKQGIPGSHGFSLSSAKSAGRHNNGGLERTALGSVSKRFCFLTRVHMEDADSGGEWAECHVAAEGGQWYVFAKLGGTSDADVFCESRCLSW